MRLQLVSDEQAKALEEIGFPFHEDFTGLYPTRELVAKWLREEKDFHINVRYLFMTSCLKEESKYTFYYGTTESGRILYGQTFNSYEEALSTGIDTAIKIIKNNE